ncbi:MAG TPA: hypothetical protein VFM82_07865 [Flavobacteriaceae bacterium]|nr:hypothetical protein [Flavobacteriaceae bacterium]
MNQLIKITELDFTTLHFYEKCVVSVIKEDVNVDQDALEKLWAAMEDFYKDKLYGYISDRKNHYSVNPLIHINSSKTPTLVGMAIVCNSHLKEMTAAFEKRFFAKPFQIFNDLNLAKIWMDSLVDEMNTYQEID